MKKSYIFIILFLLFIILITIVGSSFVSGNISIKEEQDIMVIQNNKEVYFNVYGYDINNPNVIVNPYGNSPLTAIVMFTSNDYSEVDVTIKSKNGNSDINYRFDKDKYHMIPIYGLYADYDNTVIIRCEGVEKNLSIKTEKLPGDFVFVDDMVYDNFMVYNGNYPYAIDGDGEIRWYLNSNYYGNITSLDNSSFIIGSDRYNEDGNVISFYKMNYLGKIYNEYIVNDFYGMSAVYDDNILVLSDRIIHIDLQTGEIIYDYGDNVGYDYLSVYDNNIIVGKDDIYYNLKNNKLEEIEYDKEITKVNFYSDTANYKLVSSNRFGNLKKTVLSNQNIILFDYDKIAKLENISIVGEPDRIKITNNNENNIYIILDKFMDKRIYEVDNIKYINMQGLKGEYTIYFKIDGKLYKTNYYIGIR